MTGPWPGCLVCHDDGDDCAYCGKRAGQDPEEDQPTLSGICGCGAKVVGGVCTANCKEPGVIQLIGQTRWCPFCNKDGIIIQVGARMNLTAFVTLDCNHPCNVTIQPPSWATTESDMTRRNNRSDNSTPADRAGFIKKVCACCDTAYETFWDGDIGSLCVECRNVFEVRNCEEARIVIGLFDALSPAQRVTQLATGRSHWERQGRKHTSPDATVKSVDSALGSSRHQPALPAEPPPDPVKVAAAVRGMIDYGQVADDYRPDPDRPTAYVIAKNGLFEVRTSPFATITLPVGTPATKDIPGVLAVMTAGVSLNMGKLPWTHLSQTVSFFRQVCANYRGSCEALVQLWYDRSLALDGQPVGHFLHVPDQRVSGGSVNHTSVFDREPELLPASTDPTAPTGSRYLYLGDIHSHGSSMEGFWSGIDNADENRMAEGRVFGVIGKVDARFPSWKWRMRTREGFIDLKVADLFEVDDITIPFTVSTNILLNAAADADGVKDGNVRLHCPVDLFANSSHPTDWHEAVKFGTGFTTPSMGVMGRGHHNRGSNATIPQLLYIQTGDILTEFEIEGSTRRPTGKTYRVAPIDHPSGS